MLPQVVCSDFGAKTAGRFERAAGTRGRPDRFLQTCQVSFSQKLEECIFSGFPLLPFQVYTRLLHSELRYILDADLSAKAPAPHGAAQLHLADLFRENISFDIV